MADYGAMTGGVGNGLTSFVDSYRAERGYKDAKAQLAIANAQKQRELDTQEAGEIGQYGSGGQEWMAQQAAYKAALAGRAAAQQPQAQATPQDQSVEQASGDSKDSSGGFLGPSSQDWANITGAPGIINNPPGSGLANKQPAQSPYSTVPSTTAAVNPDSAAPQPPGHVDPYAVKMAQFQKQLEMQQKAGDANLKAAQEHSPQHYAYDPKSGQVVLTQDGYSPKEAQDLKNQATNGRSAFGAGVERTASLSNAYGSEKAVSAARDQAGYVASATSAMKEGGPFADEALASALARSEGNADGDPAKAIASGSKSQALKDYVAQAASGGVTDATKQNMMSEITANLAARQKQMNSVNGKYIAKAKAAQVDPSTIVSSPDVDSALKDAQQLVATFPKQAPRDQQPGVGGFLSNLAMKFSNGPSNAAQSQAAQGPQIGTIVKGYKYLGGDPSQKSSWGQP